MGFSSIRPDNCSIDDAFLLASYNYFSKRVGRIDSLDSELIFKPFVVIFHAF